MAERFSSTLLTSLSAYLRLSLVTLLVTGGAARAEMPNYPRVVVSSAIYESLTQRPTSADQHYRAGAYFYGDDCGGNSVPGGKLVSGGLPSGVILSGQAGRDIAKTLNCDDRRSALTAYRDAFEGKIGQEYPWRNPNGGSSGRVIPGRRYRDAGFSCTNFRAFVSVSQSASRSNGTACRQDDGNWHMR